VQRSVLRCEFTQMEGVIAETGLLSPNSETSNPKCRIVVLSYESLYSSMMIAHLLESCPGQVVGIVLSSCVIQGKGLLGSLGYVVQRAGSEFFLQKSLETVEYKAIVALWGVLGKPRKQLSVAEVARKHGVPVIESADVNRAETFDWIEALSPNLIASVYLNQRIGCGLLQLRGCRTINIHPALLPRHRGLFPYFWVLADSETETGVTVHCVEEKFDTGAILAQERLEVTPADTIQSLSYRSAQIGGPLLVRAVAAVAAGVSGVPQLAPDASYHSWPTHAAYVRFRQAGRKFGGIRELMSHM
jgi:folate-dependent phosphoribosylglycinamide formyltransferase PurN